MRLLPPVERWPHWLVRVVGAVMLPFVVPVFAVVALMLAASEGAKEFRAELRERIPEVKEMAVDLWKVVVGR